MTEAKFRTELDALRNKFVQHCHGQSPAIVMTAAMEVVLNAALLIDDKEGALKLVNALRPMIDHIESRVRGTH